MTIANKHKRWTLREEIRLIELIAEGLSYKEVAALIERTEAGVGSRLTIIRERVAPIMLSNDSPVEAAPVETTEQQIEIEPALLEQPAKSVTPRPFVAKKKPSLRERVMMKLFSRSAEA